MVGVTTLATCCRTVSRVALSVLPTPCEEKQLVLTKEQTVILEVLDTDNPAGYTVGIEKSE